MTKTILIPIAVLLLVSCSNQGPERTSPFYEAHYHSTVNQAQAYVNFQYDKFRWGSEDREFESGYGLSKMHEALEPASHDNGYSVKFTEDFVVVEMLDREISFNEAFKNTGKSYAFLNYHDGTVRFEGGVISISFETQCLISITSSFSKHALSIITFEGVEEVIEIEFDLDDRNPIHDIKWSEDFVVLEYENDKGVKIQKEIKRPHNTS